MIYKKLRKKKKKKKSGNIIFVEWFPYDLVEAFIICRVHFENWFELVLKFNKVEELLMTVLNQDSQVGKLIFV